MSKSANSKALVLRLYVAGNAPRSTTAIRNLRSMCDKHAGDGYELEVVDVVSEPLRALSDGILVTPTLLKVKPAPAHMLLGDLSEVAVVLAALGLSLAHDE